MLDTELLAAEVPDDDSLLDAYSGAVIGALGRAAPAVAFIEVAGEARGGAGPPRPGDLLLLRRSDLIHVTLRPTEKGGNA
jgi:hypothetical protein